MILAGLIAARFTHYTALTLLFGAATFLIFAAPKRQGAESGSDVSDRLRPLLVWSSAGTVATGTLVLSFTAANMAGALGGMTDAATLQTILVDTDFGRVWAFRLAAALALVAWLFFGRAPRWADWVVLLLAGAVLATVALTGHAQIRTGLAGLAHRAADAGHVVAAAVWLGALPPFLFFLHASRTRSGEDAARAARLLHRFHAVGLTAVAALLATGLVNSWFLVGSLDALVSTTYGRLLLVKIGLFAAMVALAADNRLRLVPQLRLALAQGLPPERWLARLRTHVRWEFRLGLGVLAAVSALGALAPAIDAAGGS